MKRILATLLAVMMVFALMCGSAAAQEETDDLYAAMNTGSIRPTADTTIIQLGHCDPGSDVNHYTYFCHQLSDYLMTMSDGKYAIECMSDNQLGGERDLFEGMTMGTIDAAIVTNYIFSSSMNTACFMDLPFFFNSAEEAQSVFQNEELMAPVVEELDRDWNIHCAAYIEGGFRKVLTINDPIDTVDSFKGLKIRTPETMVVLDTFNTLGASPSAMALGEALTAIQQGTFDAIELPITPIYSNGVYKVCKYLTETNHIYTCAAVMFSNSFWNSLSEEDQAMFDEACKKAADDEIEFVRSNESDYLAEIGEFGTEIVELDDATKQAMRDAVKPMYEKYRELIGPEQYDKVVEFLESNR